MRRWMTAGAMAWGIVMGPLAAYGEAPQDDATLARAALDALKAQHNAEVLTMTQPAAARQAARDKDTSRAWFCSHSMPETLIYAMQGKALNKAVTVLSGDVCDVLYFRAYALGNLKRQAEAREQLLKLTAMAPNYAHYGVELAFATRMAGDQDEALALYRHAVEVAGDSDRENRAAALRGIGFILTEKGDLEGAQASYMASLKDEPDNPLAQNELRYIRKLRAGAAVQPGQVVDRGQAPISKSVGDK